MKKKKGKTEPVVSFLGEDSINFMENCILQQYKEYSAATKEVSKESMLGRIREAKIFGSLGQPSGNRRTNGARFVLRDVEAEKEEEPENKASR